MGGLLTLSPLEAVRLVTASLLVLVDLAAGFLMIIAPGGWRRLTKREWSQRTWMWLGLALCFAGGALAAITVVWLDLRLRPW